MTRRAHQLYWIASDTVVRSRRTGRPVDELATEAAASVHAVPRLQLGMDDPGPVITWDAVRIGRDELPLFRALVSECWLAPDGVPDYEEVLARARARVEGVPSD